jgi:streptogramin lyase
VAAVLAALPLLSGGGPATVEVVPNSVAIIEPADNRVVASLPTGAESPGAIDHAGRNVWVVNHASFSVTAFDAKTRKPVNTFGVGPDEGYPNGLAADSGGVWLTGSASSRVTWYGGNLTEAVEVAEGGYTLGTGSELARIGQDLWVTGVIQPLVADVDVSDFSPKVLFRLRLERAPTALAVDQKYGYVGDAEGNLLSIDPVTQEQRSVRLASRIEDIVVAGGSIWLVTDEPKLLRLAPGSLTTSGTADLTDPPSALAFGAGGVWVVSADAGTVTRVDPQSMKVVKTITIGHRPQGVVVAEGLVWVTVRR